MEGFDFDDDNAMKANNSSSMLTLGGFRQIKKLFRLLEILIILVLLTWAFRRLPFAVRISGEYLRQLINLFLGHLFVFVLANIIVLTLFLKSRNLFLHNEFRDISDATSELCRRFGGDTPMAEEVVYHDKETILEVTKVRVHRRSRSANFRREGGCAKELRRSETEMRRRVAEEQSNEEFQRSIEEFIARQVKFHQQEKLAIVLHGCN